METIRHMGQVIISIMIITLKNGKYLFNLGLGADSNCTLARRAMTSIRSINCRDLFVPPSFDELDAVAVNTKGEPRHLNTKQLESLRERG